MKDIVQWGFLTSPDGCHGSERTLILLRHAPPLQAQVALLSEDAPVRHTAKHRRLKMVMQGLIYVSAKRVAYARQKLLNFGRHCQAFVVFERLYGQWSTGYRLETTATRASVPAEERAHLAIPIMAKKTALGCRNGMISGADVELASLFLCKQMARLQKMSMSWVGGGKVVSELADSGN